MPHVIWSRCVGVESELLGSLLLLALLMVKISWRRILERLLASVLSIGVDIDILGTSIPGIVFPSCCDSFFSFVRLFLTPRLTWDESVISRDQYSGTKSTLVYHLWSKLKTLLDPHVPPPFKDRNHIFLRKRQSYYSSRILRKSNLRFSRSNGVSCIISI